MSRLDRPFFSLNHNGEHISRCLKLKINRVFDSLITSYFQQDNKAREINLIQFFE